MGPGDPASQPLTALHLFHFHPIPQPLPRLFIRLYNFVPNPFARHPKSKAVHPLSQLPSKRQTDSRQAPLLISARRPITSFPLPSILHAGQFCPANSLTRIIFFLLFLVCKCWLAGFFSAFSNRIKSNNPIPASGPSEVSPLSPLSCDRSIHRGAVGI